MFRNSFPSLLIIKFMCLFNCLVYHSQALEVNRQPNIVFILADDLAWSDLQCYGHAYHKTPNLNQLASQGMRYTNGYSPAPICSAARASILTGKTVARLGFEFVTKNEPGHQKLDSEVPLITPKLTLNLPTSEVTIPEHLNKLGYTTAFFGKWHVSQHYQKRYLAWHPEYGPRQQGFKIAEEDFGDHPYSWSKNNPPKDLPNQTFPKDSMIQRTVEFINNQQELGTPFFLMVSNFYVHTPVKNRCRWLVDQYSNSVPQDAVNRDKRLEYAAFVETLDHHVGSIIKALEQSGQSKNTLVLFTSDNGGHPEYCSNAPLRGSKWNLYEGGIRVPFLACWPQYISAGTTCDTPVIGYDLLPTFVSLAGGKLKSSDGINIAPSFSNTLWNPKRNLVWHFPYYHPERTFSKAIDQTGIDDFTTSKTRPQSALRHGNYKIIQFAEHNQVEVYDLSKDVSEQNNLSTNNPELAFELTKNLESTLTSMNARRAIPKN